MKQPDYPPPKEVLQKAACETETYFANKNWVVEPLPPEKLAQLMGAELECGDGRYGLLQNHKLNPALFGGFWGFVAMHPEFATGIDEDTINQALKMLRAQNLIAGVHGDHHNENLGCGFLDLWINNKLKDVNKLNLQPDILNRVINDHKTTKELKHNILPGKHQENVLRISFKPKYGPELDPQAFRLTGDFALQFGISVEVFCSVTEQTVRILTENKINKLQIAYP